MNFIKNKKVLYQDLGLVAYEQAQDYQEELFNEIIETKIANRKLLPEKRLITPNYLLFCEHPHVYTLGKSGDENNLLVNRAELNGIQAEFHRIGRGGDITYHGPGQIVGYPILDLDNFFTDIHKYLRLLEEVVIRTLSEFDIESGRVDGLTGVWIDGDTPNARKICAMGIRASRWVTMHGFALNVNTSLNYFNHIIPCGINDKKVTSLQLELGDEVDIREVKEKLLKNFSEQFRMELVRQEKTTEI